MNKTIHKYSTVYLTLFCLAFVAAIVVTDPQSARAADKPVPQESDLIAILESNAPPQDKAIPCKQLAVFGSEAAVPALAKLLPDPELTSWARIALEAIPGPAADTALREAIDKVEDRILIGVINSVAVRRDAKAVDRLIQRLTDNNAEVASAAAVALGRIGNEAASGALTQELAKAPEQVRSSIAEGCVLCAQKQLNAGNSEDATKLYDLVRNADVLQQRVLEATRGAILARGSAGVSLLAEQLGSTDKARFQLGLMTAREIPGPAVTEALVAQMGKATPYRQMLLVLALADRTDATVLPAVMKIAKNAPAEVRVAAMDALQRVGDVSSIPTLLKIAIDSDADLAQMAKAALEGLVGPEINADLVGRLTKTQGKMRQAVIEVAGRRRISDAVPALLKAVSDSDGEVRTAALTALGETVGPADLSVLIKRAIASTHPSPVEAEAAMKALRAACIRMPDREACATQILAAMSQAPIATKCAVVEILGSMGGANALRALGAAAKDGEPEIQDTASRMLGEWMTADAAPVLLDVAKSDSKFKVRALRGYLRIPRQFRVPVDQAVTMCRAAIEAAERDNERELVLEVAERYPSVGMFQLAAQLAKTPALKSKATATSLAIAQKIGGESTDVKKLLDQIGLEPVKIEILKAEYGANGKFKDVTKTLQKHVNDFPLIVLPSTSYNASFGGDPVPSTVKQLKVEYRIDGKSGKASFPENAVILLPAPKS